MYKMDSASMANSLEVRNPYLDYRVVEQAISMPLNCKINNGEQKYLMKKLLERYIPKHLVYRTKWGFPAPVGDWLYKELKHLPDMWLNEDRIRKQGIFNPAEVTRWVKSFKEGKHYHYKRIWSLIIFQMWYQEYMKE
jgi:asparagine synthase (glutamine-hydrolysing)